MSFWNVTRELTAEEGKSNITYKFQMLFEWTVKQIVALAMLPHDFNDQLQNDFDVNI